MKSASRWAVAFVLAPLLVAPEARANAPRVAIVRPADAVAVEAVTRIQGELTSVGFEVTVLVRSGQADPRREVEVAAREQGADAALSIVDTAEEHTADVWIADRLTGKTVVKHLEVSGADARASAALAVQVVELLRGSLLDLLFRRSGSGVPEAPRRPEVTKWVEGLADQTAWLGLEVGPAVLDSFAGIGPSVMAEVRVGYRLDASWVGRVSIALPITRPQVGTALGNATVGQSLSLLELVHVFRPGAVLRPTVSAGAGAYRVEVGGSGLGPYVGRSEGFWGAAADVGLGVALRLGQHIAVSAETHGTLMFPYPAIQLADTEVGHVGRPALLAGIGLVTWL
jgi:hypothetical protein